MKRLLTLILSLWLVLPGAVAYADTVVVGGGGTPAVVDSTDTSTWVLLSDDQTSSAVVPKTDGGLTYNASTGVLTATGFSGPITGAVTGNASTATALAANPTDCGAGEFANAIAANGNLTCAGLDADLTTVAGLSVAEGKFIVGSAAPAWSLSAYKLPIVACAENQILKANGSGDLVCAADADSGGATALDDIGDPDAATTVAMGDNESLTLESAEDTGTVLIIKNTDADLAGATSLIDLQYNDDGSANGYFIRGYDNSYTDLKFSIGADGAATFGAVTASSVTVSPSADPTLTMSDSDNEVGSAKIYGISSGGDNDIIMYLGVEIAGSTTNFVEIDGVSETIDLLKPVVLSGLMTADATAGVQIGTTGVLISSDNDGAITFLGKSAGYDEDLTINLDDTENTAVVSSSTGVTAISFSALNLVTTGTVSAGIPIVTDADGRNLTASECYGTLHVATGAGTWLLPAAAAGMNLCVLVTGASDVIIDIDADDDITLVGVQDTNGDGITNASGSSSGDFVCLIAVDADHWYVMGKQGTWAAQ